jgi:hypothetical protein
MIFTSATVPITGMQTHSIVGGLIRTESTLRLRHNCHSVTVTIGVQSRIPPIVRSPSQFFAEPPGGASRVADGEALDATSVQR